MGEGTLTQEEVRQELLDLKRQIVEVRVEMSRATSPFALKLQNLGTKIERLRDRCGHDYDYPASDYSGDTWWYCPICEREDYEFRCKHQPSISAGRCYECCPYIDPEYRDHDFESPNHVREGCRLCDFHERAEIVKRIVSGE